MSMFGEEDVRISTRSTDLVLAVLYLSMRAGRRCGTACRLNIHDIGDSSNAHSVAELSLNDEAREQYNMGMHTLLLPALNVSPRVSVFTSVVLHAERAAVRALRR